MESSEKFHEEYVFSLLVDAVKDYAIFMLDPTGNVRTWNAGATRISGYSSKDIIGKHFSIFYTAEAQSALHPQHELDVATAEGRYEEQGWRIRKDGSMYWANVTITAIFSDETLIGFAKVTRDLTEQVNAERAKQEHAQQLSQANIELQNLARSVSNELQDPVANILSYSKLLAARYRSRMGSDVDELLDHIVSGAKLTERLVSDLWTYARITRPNIAFEPVATDRILREAKGQLSEECYQSRCEVISPPDSQMPILEGNREQLCYVFKELILNALKHRRNKSGPPVIEIKVEKEEDGWLFSFKDNGPGIDRFFSGQIFHLYKRGGRRPDESGSGMGLPTCKKIIEELHHGRLGFESVQGEWTNFVIWLPATQHPQSL